MHRFIKAALNTVVELAMFIVVAIATIFGAKWGQGPGEISIGGACVGLVAGFAISTILFGVIILLLDIERNTREMAEHTRQLLGGLSARSPDTVAQTIHTGEPNAAQALAQSGEVADRQPGLGKAG